MKSIKNLISLAGLTGGILASSSALAAEGQAADPPAAPAAAENPAPAAAGATNAVVPVAAMAQTATNADQVTTPAVTNAVSTNDQTAAAQDMSTNNGEDFAPDKGIRFNFRNVPLEQVLNYMSKAAGFVIHPQVSLNGRVDAWSDQPLSKDEALDLVEHVLTDNGYAVIRDGRILTIISAMEAKKKDIPVKRFTSVEDIPRNNEMATYIIPVRTLNVIALVKNLTPLISTDTTDLQANESANSLMITDTQINIRRIADIVMKLDSVSSSINTIKVYPLKYADAKAMVTLVKDLFPSTGGGGGTTGGAAGGGARAGALGAAVARAAGGGGGGGGWGFWRRGAGGFPNFAQLFGGGGGGDPTGSTPTSRVAATSDDHSNALVVSAPEDLISTIDELVSKIDQPIEDITEVKIFHLKNADCGEMANLLGISSPIRPARTPARGYNMAARPAAGVARRAAVAARRAGAARRRQIRLPAFLAGAPELAREPVRASTMKKMGHVMAVPDLRTQTLVVSASKDLMPQIEDMINQLDDVDAGSLHVHYITLKNAEAQDVQQIVQDLFPAGSTTSRSTTTQNNPLLQRATTVQQNTLSSGVSSGITSGSTGGRGGGL